MIKCEKCGKPIHEVDVLIFTREGSDVWATERLEECENEAVYIDTSMNWTAFDEDDDSEEKKESIRCPLCHEYPFKSKEMHTYDFVRVVMFRERRKDEFHNQGD